MTEADPGPSLPRHGPSFQNIELEIRATAQKNFVRSLRSPSGFGNDLFYGVKRTEARGQCRLLPLLQNGRSIELKVKVRRTHQVTVTSETMKHKEDQDLRYRARTIFEKLIDLYN